MEAVRKPVMVSRTVSRDRSSHIAGRHVTQIEKRPKSTKRAADE
jgi:hypothetical protein